MYHKLSDQLEIKEHNGEKTQNQPMPYCPVKITKCGSFNLYEVYLIGDIVDVDDYVDLIDTLLTANEGDEYHIYIDSPGGYISAGSIIASAIDRSRANVYTHAVGMCASAACLIHNAAHSGNALVDEFGILMIHMSMHGDQGVSSQIAARAADQVRYVLNNLLGQAREMGYIYDDELERIQTGENIYLSAKDFEKRVKAKELGIRADDTEHGKDDSSIAGTENWDIDFSSISPEKSCYFPNSEKSSYRKYITDLKNAETHMLSDNMGSPTDAIAVRIRAVKANTLRIRSTDGINFRIYIPSDLMMTRTYVTNLCLFLSSLTSEQTVTFILGAKIVDEVATNIGAVISAMKKCKAQIITVAAGYCSIPETIIWMYGNQRYVYTYGALTFGKTDLVRFINKYDEFFNVAFMKGKELGLLNDDDIANLRQHKTKMILRQDLPHNQY